MSVIVTCNAGSVNNRLAAFDAATLGRKGHKFTHSGAEVEEWLCSIGEYGIFAIGHRVVHGGQEFTEPALITDAVLAQLKTLIPLAPIHQPAAIALIEAARKLYPDVAHIACFDTAFHHTISENQRRFAIPRALHDAGIMRYGFHGLSYQHIAQTMPKHDRVIVAHLGGGSSACAMKNGKSVACTTGFSTLDGLMMSTRCGTLDPGVLLYLLAQKNMSVAEVSNILYFESGLKGVSGVSGNMQDLLASQNHKAQEAIELYCACAAKEISGLLPALGGIDALIFTGGIGEHAPEVRSKIIQLLHWIGNFAVYVIPSDEEIVIAAACQIYRR
jgi:acetate kinase